MPNVKSPLDSRKNSRFSGKEDREPGEIDDLAVRLDLREVGVDGEVGGEGRKHRRLRVEPGLDREVPWHLGLAGQVVLRGLRLGKPIGPHIHVVAAPQGPEAGDFTLIQELEEALGAPPRPPECFLILPPNEALDVEPENGLARVEAKGTVGDAELGGPSGRVPAGRDVPDSIPILVDVLESGELGIPHGPVRIGAEEECAAVIAKAVDQESDVVIHGQVRVAAELAGTDHPRHRIIGADADVEGVRSVKDVDHRALARRSPRTGLALAQIAEGVCLHPRPLFQPAVQSQDPIRDRASPEHRVSALSGRTVAHGRGCWRGLDLSRDPRRQGCRHEQDDCEERARRARAAPTVPSTKLGEASHY